MNINKSLFLSKFDSHLFIILGLPILLLGIGHRGFFTNVSGIDPWVYFGYFINLDSLLHLFPNTYYGSRLAWNLPGYLIHSLFSPVVADYVLHLGFYYVAVFSLYFTLKYTIGRHAALFASVFMGSYIYFLYPISWDYVDGAGITYFLVTTLMFTLATQISAWPFWLFLSGVGYGALVYTNLFLVTFTPLFVIYYLSLNYLIPKRQTV